MSVILPDDLDGVFRALEEPGARLLAGGTDLLVRERIARTEGRAENGALIGLERVAALQGVTREADGALRIGAMTCFAALAAHPEVRAAAPVLALAAAEVGGPAIRNMGTLGGNLVTASPAGDSLPALAVLGAEVEVTARSGIRRLACRDFITGPRRTVLVPGEVLTAVVIPTEPAFDVTHFEKVGRRDALSIAVVSLAALLRFDARGRVAEARLAWGSVSPVVHRIPEVEAVLVGRSLTPSVLMRAGEAARRAVAPVDDLRASAAYRRAVAGNLLMRLAVTAPPVAG